jgi:hypothetical protein
MKKLILAATILFGALGLSGVAHADIFSPITPNNYKLTATVPTAFDSSTLLADAAQVINYLGVKEGEAYSFNQHKWVTTTGATIISLPWNFSLGVSMLNADGVTGNVEWNIGNYLPVASVPIMKYTQYLYVFAGAGGEENTAGTAFKFTSVAGGEFKFSF